MDRHAVKTVTITAPRRAGAQ